MSTYAARRVLTTSDVAELAQVDEATIRRAVRAGDLPAVRLGPGRRLLRYHVADVNRWLGHTPEEDPDGAA